MTRTTKKKLDELQKKIDEIQSQFASGLITSREKYCKMVDEVEQYRKAYIARYENDEVTGLPVSNWNRLVNRAHDEMKLDEIVDSLNFYF